MAEPRTIRSLGVEAVGRPGLFEYTEGLPGPGQIRLDTLYSGISAGTELTFLKGTNPYLSARWDQHSGRFVRGEPGVTLPLPFIGYMEVAKVDGAGDDVLTDGSIAAATYGHKSGHTADPRLELLVPLPSHLDPLLGIFVAQMGPIAANGILQADAEFCCPSVSRLGDGVRGRRAVVMGAGTVGLLTALFARHLGALEVVVADPSPYRRGRAEAMGLTALDEARAGAHVKARWHCGSDRGADLVFQTRARSQSLHEALRMLRPQGSVIDLAFYQDGAERLRLGEEFHHNGLTLRAAQIGRVPRGLADSWDRMRLSADTIALLEREGDAIARHLITHVVPFDEGPAFLARLFAERIDFIQIVLRF